MGGTKYPRGIVTPRKPGCRECGHGLGLNMTSAGWRGRHKFCCTVCKRTWLARYWRDFRQRWWPVFIPRPP